MWVKTALEKWTEASGILDGALFRSIDRNGRVWGTGMTPKVLWEIVKAAAARAEPQPLERGVDAVGVDVRAGGLQRIQRDS